MILLNQIHGVFVSFKEKFTDAKGDIERLRTMKGENEARKRSVELIEPIIKSLPLRRNEIEQLSKVVQNPNWGESKEKAR